MGQNSRIESQLDILMGESSVPVKPRSRIEEQLDEIINSGITKATKWRGVTTTALTDGANTNPITINGASYTAVEGDIVSYGLDEFVFNGSVWQKFGGEVDLHDVLRYTEMNLTAAQKRQALLNLDGVRIVTLDDETETLASITAKIAEINQNGEHVFFDTSALAYPLYLCTIAVQYENDSPVSYRLNDLVSGNISMGMYDASLTLADILANAVSAFYTLTVTAQTKDGVTVTGQTVTVRAGNAEGRVYATASYDGQPVSFSVPNGYEYYVSISSTLPQHFNPTTASGIISGANAIAVLTYSDVSNISGPADFKAAIDGGADMSNAIGVTFNLSTKPGYTEEYDLTDKTGDTYTFLRHEALDNMVFEPPQALRWTELGMGDGNYKFKHNNVDYYFTLTTAVPAGGQLRATTSAFTTYSSPDSTVILESGTVDTTVLADATDLGTTAAGDLNNMDRVIYGSNNFGESGNLQWMNSDAAANTQMPKITRFQRPHTVNQAGYLTRFTAEDLAAIDDTEWSCSANNVYECPPDLGGISIKGSVYRVTKKFGLASEKEIFGAYSGVDAGDSVFDLYGGDDITDSDRIKYGSNGTARIWWLRSPDASGAGFVRTVYASGTASYSSARNSNGVVPACKISKSTA